MWRNRSISALLPPLAYLLLAAVFTWPLATHLTTALGSGLDPLLQTWVLAWNAHALTTDPLAVWHAPIFFPYPDTLAYSDHHLLITVVALPIIATGGPVLAHNLLVLTSYALTGWAVYLLAYEMSAGGQKPWIRAASAFVAGTVFAFGTYRMTHVVHLQLLQTAWLPLALLFLRRLLRASEDGGRWRDAALFGLFAGVQCVTALYYAYFTALTLGLYTALWLWEAIRQPARTGLLRCIGGLTLGTGLAALITVPLTLPYLRIYEYLGVVRSLRELDNWSAPLQAYLAVLPTNWLYGGHGWSAASGGEFALFPGFVTIGLAVSGVALTLWKRAGDRRTTPDNAPLARDVIFLVLLGISAFVLSLGTGIRLERGGDVVPIPLPYPLLYERIPGFGALRVPVRWAMLTHLALALLTGIAITHLGRWLVSVRQRNRLAVAALTAVGTVALVEHAAFPVPLAAPPSSPPVYAWLGAQPDIRAILELPVGPTPRGAELERITIRQFHQMQHWKPLATGYSGIIPFGTTDLLRRVQRLPDDDTLRYLALTGIDTLVIHRNEYDAEKLARLLAWADTTPLLQRRGEVGHALVYTITPEADMPLPEMASVSVFVSSDERVPGVLALGLIRRWEAEGAILYGAGRTRYYPDLQPLRPGQVCDYGLLADGEDPVAAGYSIDGLRWRSNGLAFYARDPRLIAALDLAQPVAGQFHPAYPSMLTVMIEEQRVRIADVLIPLETSLTEAHIELDIASLSEQAIVIDNTAYAISPGAATVTAPIPLQQPVFIAGDPGAVAIQRIRVLSAPRAPAPPPEGALALSADSRFHGSRLFVTAHIGGAGALVIDVRGAAARDDRPIHLLEGVLPVPSDGNTLVFSIDLLAPNEPWVTHRGEAEDGRYIVYLKPAARPGALGAPIATFFIRNGAISDSQPAPLPLRIVGD
ncbi:MAG: hypothetical protein NZ699_01030 [Roseiflexus sp.]|nr:hypothetical protein [Roseiflexus sp.]MDW8147893.1 hypothetical protein [Roseiflexaceae bacterium]MDW8231929.1 hypothetical protein [Roseiflexaceae bacterium]